MTEHLPVLILAAGMLTVIGMIVKWRINAFLALITAALVVSLLSPGLPAEKVTRVAQAFGAAAGSIGIVIALAAVIGMCMMNSGAADRIVRSFLDLLGEKRAGAALASSGFALSIPVFFDTVFYLLVPLARSLYRQTRRHYLKYLMAITAGAAITHTLVPPTPGPLLMADNLGVDIGSMMLTGMLVGLPALLVGLWYARWLDGRLPIEALPNDDPAVEPGTDALPGLGVALLPIALPVLLIASNTLLLRFFPAAPQLLRQVAALLGNPNLALLLSATVAILIYLKHRRPDRAAFSDTIESALMSGGMIILITAAGGTFGAMLKLAGLGPWIESRFASGETLSGFGLMLTGFAVASLLKFAQGSTTVAMITASAMLGALVTPGELAFNPVYLATAVGGGALVGSWMNDSGFWIYSKMGGLSEVETLKSWTPLLSVIGLSIFGTTLLMAWWLPGAF